MLCMQNTGALLCDPQQFEERGGCHAMVDGSQGRASQQLAAPPGKPQLKDRCSPRASSTNAPSGRQRRRHATSVPRCRPRPDSTTCTRWFGAPSVPRRCARPSSTSVQAQVEVQRQDQCTSAHRCPTQPEGTTCDSALAVPPEPLFTHERFTASTAGSRDGL